VLFSIRLPVISTVVCAVDQLQFKINSIRKINLENNFILIGFAPTNKVKIIVILNYSVYLLGVILNELKKAFLQKRFFSNT
jgi:hypothetical protein